VDSPQTLYDRPANLFVAGFIGSPAMNMVEAELERSDGSLHATFGGIRLRVDEELLSARPAVKQFEGKKVVLGIRPEDFEDATLVTEASEDKRIPTTVDLREALGSEVLIHFSVNAPVAMTQEMRELAADVGAETAEDLEGRTKEDTSVFVARLNPRTRARVGERIDLAVDTRALHFFDPDSGAGLYDQAP
jgi:multiple sugar transport system ATP-binding protein